TRTLDGAGVTRATVETVAENFVDGFLSPLFWALVLGVPGAVAYKMVNTLDSMVGYQNDTYILFGRASARIDDAANFIPARLAVLVIAAATSFIYPDHILPNVRKIGAQFDEIELLVFESIPKTVLPGKAEIAELAALSRDLDVGYNIHLPTDISLTHGALHHRQKAADTIARVVALCEPLAPSTHTLH
ncbi:MAG: cobamide remodeling phosphodiesterase CbiR, partial [Desulfotignum sp.]